MNEPQPGMCKAAKALRNILSRGENESTLVPTSDERKRSRGHWRLRGSGSKSTRQGSQGRRLPCCRSHELVQNSHRLGLTARMRKVKQRRPGGYRNRWRADPPVGRPYCGAGPLAGFRRPVAAPAAPTCVLSAGAISIRRTPRSGCYPRPRRLRPAASSSRRPSPPGRTDSRSALSGR